MNRIFVRIFIDFLLVVVPAVVLLVLVIVNPTFERGFYCDDESLHYPYKPDTITIAQAALIAALGPFLIILVSETLLHFGVLRSAEGRRQFSHCLYAHLGPFVAGLVFQQLTSEIGKHIIGRLRPHFFDVCRPSFIIDGRETTCETLDKPWNHYVIVDRNNPDVFNCTNEDSLNADGSWDKTLQDSVKSFPSAHSSVSFYGMLFLAIYCQRRLNCSRHANVLTIFFQMTFLVFAFAIALSRISDYKHHWSDVLSGSILGIVTAVLIARFSNFCLESNTHDHSPTKEGAKHQPTELVESPADNQGKQYVNARAVSQTTIKANETSVPSV